VTVLTFFSWLLVTIVGVTLLWPLNIPLAALAYKLRQGNQPIPLEPGPFWWRSTFAALGLFVLSWITVGLAPLLIKVFGADVRNAVHLVLLLVYLPAAIGYFLWMFALEDFFQALSVFVLYIIIPGLPFFLVYRLIHGWKALSQDPSLLQLFLFT
jgi:hypothetical protein